MGRKGRSADRSPVMEEEEIPSWVIDVNNLMNEGQKLDAGRSWTIYRVPDNLCEVQKSAFVPKLVSIGPFHYKDSKLHAMEAHKMRFLVRLFSELLHQTEQPDGKLYPSDAMQLEDVTKAMKFREQKARDCYSESFSIPSDDFVRMMVVDGCFVVELLRLFYKIRMGNDFGADEPIFASGWMVRTLQRDLLMLENQLPYFVLEDIFKLTSKNRKHKQKPSLAHLALTFFHRFLPRYEVTPLISNHTYDHLLDLLRSSFLSMRRRHERCEWRIYHHSDWGLDRLASQNDNNSQRCSSVVGLIFCGIRTGRGRDKSRQERSTLVIPQVHYKHLINPVEELLKNGGISIQKHKGLDLLDIRFSEGILRIPRLVIDDDTIPLFFNFVALEQCNLVAVNPFFISFFVFLDSLVCSAQDVEFLCKRRVINHSLESDQVVASLINKLGREMVYDESKFYFDNIVTLINEHYKAYLSSRWSQYRRKWYGWWTKLIRDYFNNPWSIISLLAAVVLLILTCLQTIYTIYGFYQT